jgi:hypothetical protein
VIFYLLCLSRIDQFKMTESGSFFPIASNREILFMPDCAGLTSAPERSVCGRSQARPKYRPTSPSHPRSQRSSHTPKPLRHRDHIPAAMNDDQSPPKNWDKRILGIGGSAIVSLYDETTVLKGYSSRPVDLVLQAQDIPRLPLMVCNRCGVQI